MNIRVSTTNSSGTNKTAVRVYVDGVKIAEVSPNSRVPLEYIRNHKGKYRDLIVQQCKSGGLSDSQILQHLGV